MENQLEIIKSHLPGGYEKKIAEEVGCSTGTVHNILNSRHTSRSSYKAKIMAAAARLAQENIKAMQDIADTAAGLEKLTPYEPAS